ncbi:MAG: cupin domain-containing protein [Candidatus Dadabacteria bacterium]|nr:cupin domain-containing protein [Candidatus Dadabacteria bacterium]
MKGAQKWIDALQLIKHPEGGYYKETYRSKEVIKQEHLPKRFSGNRNFSTAIYFLLIGHDFSAFHRIKQDELWHFYEGSSLTIHIIDQSDKYLEIKIGRNIEDGEALQAVVKAGCLFGTTVNDKNSFSLVGCTVAPGFDFEDFETPSRNELLRKYPQHKKIVEMLTR